MITWFRSVVARLTREPASPYPSRIGWHGMPAAGVRVNADTAFQIAAVWAAHRYLTQTVAQLPVRVMRERGKGSERVAAHPVANIFTWRTNPELSPFQLKETLTGWAVMRGNGVAEIERAGGRVIALWPIHPDRVQFRRDLETGALIYRISNGAHGTVDLDGSDVFHLRGYGDGPVGMSVVEHAAESLGWAKAAEIFGAAFFGNGLNPGGVIEGAGNLSDDGQKRLRAELQARHGGPRRSAMPLFLDKAMKWVQTSVKPNDSQFIETMQHQVEEVCRWFGVPPHKVAHLLRSTFSNIEHQSIEVVVDSIAPWAIRWEEEANYKLFGQNRLGFFVKFDLKGLMRGDFKSRQEGLQIMRRSGVVNADEWRDLEDMGPLSGAGGEKYIVEQAMTTLDKVGEEPIAPASVPANDVGAPAARMANIASMRQIGRSLADAA